MCFCMHPLVRLSLAPSYLATPSEKTIISNTSGAHCSIASHRPEANGRFWRTEASHWRKPLSAWVRLTNWLPPSCNWGHLRQILFVIMPWGHRWCMHFGVGIDDMLWDCAFHLVDINMALRLGPVNVDCPGEGEHQSCSCWGMSTTEHVWAKGWLHH